MRSKEEIAMIANEIHEAVQRKIILDDSKRLMKKYAPNIMHTIGLAAIINGVTIPTLKNKSIMTAAERILNEK
jgi:hypothetical protein